MQKKKRKFGVAWIGLAALLPLALTACGGSKGDTLTIGTQTYTEPKILAEMYKALIEDKTGLKVKIKPDLAASKVVIDAMKKGDIQMATLYSGEIYNGYFDIPDTKDRAEVLKAAQEGFDKNYGFKWYDSYGFENTYAFAVRQDVADQYQLKTVSDLKDHAKDLKLGVDTTWLERDNDGYKAFQQAYGFSFGQTFPMEISLVYKAAGDRKVDAVLAYTTDPGIKQYNLVTLEDDKHFFPPYDASPVIRKDMLEKHPELNDIISELIGKIDAKTMGELNYQVDVEQRSPDEVAVEYLKQNGLLD